MKPAPFSYLRPDSLSEACDALASDEDARVLAGGQTLVPMLAMRLSRPSLLVDITRLDALKGITQDGDTIVIGAATRQVDALRSELIARQVPLLAAALPNVGHPPTRNRGTVGGSVAHGDPSAEISLAVAILDARIMFRDSDGAEEALEAEEFFIGPTVTAAPPAGLLTRLVFPARPQGALGAGFREIASRRSDYAFASAGAQVLLDADGVCTRAWMGIGSVGDVPEAIDISALEGSSLSDADLTDAINEALRDLETVDDLHATATYRKRAAGRLALQAMQDARVHATAEGNAT